ncbi:helix-turn-helix domain-containing protein [Actinomadura atramentaria]|uniref:helix-turn-helix domain-containing protein n=1 Tax=Actinomadura atramentaria TaxID=1990 RepID=UPI000370F34A|nr:helix-turn-helix transcriptional regulator [Actinomadura atramentaria]
MISPYVRRLRLAKELRELRQSNKVTHQELSRRSGVNRQTISKLENGHISPDQDDVLSLLDALGVAGLRWTEVIQIANEAASRGWWEGISKQIGERQALIANLEAGAETIRDYPQALIPGLLQTPEYTRARVEVSDERPMAPGVTLDGILRGRSNRQRLLRRPGGGAHYEGIIDEIAIRRLAVPPDVLRNQLLHIAESAEADDRIKVRVLPVDAQIANFAIPICPFTIFTYVNGDPTVVAIEAATTDVVLVDDSETSAYNTIFDGLRAASLSVEDSHAYLIKAAERLRA